MMEIHTVAINRSFLMEAIQKQELKQYWIAEMVGVHRVTLSGWLSGRICRVKRSRVSRLAEIIGCEFEQLVLKDRPKAVKELDRKKVFDQMDGSSLGSILSTLGHDDLYENLISLVIAPDMSREQLCRAHTALAQAQMKQGKFSLNLDEATSNTNQKVLTILVSYFLEAQ